MEANLDLVKIESIEISLQNLIGANHINCYTYKGFFRRGHKYAKMRLKEKKKL